MESTASVSKRGILVPGAEGTRFHLARHAPSADLGFFVERYWTVRWDLTGGPPHEQETLPHPTVNLVVEAGQSAVHGVGTRRFSVRLSGQGQVVAAKFKPGAFFPWLGRPVSEITDRSLPLAELFGAGEDLEREVLAIEDDARQIALLEAFLRARMPPRDDAVTAIVASVQLALDHPELTRVEELAAALDISVRTLERRFRRYVGVSPKWVIRRFRMHEAADRVAAGNVVDWAGMAQDLGYFDQAHFVRDFTDQVGRSPTEYAEICVRAAAGLQRTALD
jgi:AraC-like DNA-binding protein